MSWIGLSVVLLSAGALFGCGDSEREKACKDAQWSAKAGWSEAERELQDLRKWLREYDVWHLQSRNPGVRVGSMMGARDKKWTMWEAAGKAATEAGERAWEQPSKAVFHSRSAASACETAENTSPPVQKRGGEDASEEEPEGLEVLDWWTPGKRALTSCREAGVKGAEAWKLCSFQEPTTGDEKSLEQIDVSFF